MVLNKENNNVFDHIHRAGRTAEGDAKKWTEKENVSKT